MGIQYCAKKEDLLAAGCIIGYEVETYEEYQAYLLLANGVCYYPIHYSLPQDSLLRKTKTYTPCVHCLSKHLVAHTILVVPISKGLT